MDHFDDTCALLDCRSASGEESVEVSSPSESSSCLCWLDDAQDSFQLLRYCVCPVKVHRPHPDLWRCMDGVMSAGNHRCGASASYSALA